MPTRTESANPEFDPFGAEFEPPQPNPEALGEAADGKAHLDLDRLDLRPVLWLAEQLLPAARELAAWSDGGVMGKQRCDPYSGKAAQNGPLGDIGCRRMQKLAMGWRNMDRTLRHLHLWNSDVVVRGEDANRRLVLDALQDLARIVFRCYLDRTSYKFEWDEEPTEEERLKLWPGDCVGMPHGEFVRRLELVVALLKQVTARRRPGSSSPKPRMSVAEANDRAQTLINRLGKKFFRLSRREQAARIGCAYGTWIKTACYRAAVKHGKIPTSKKKSATGSGRPAASLTPTLEAQLGEGKPDEVLHQLMDAEEKRKQGGAPSDELQDLIAEQAAEMEQDPGRFDDRRRRAYQRKRV